MPGCATPQQQPQSGGLSFDLVSRLLFPAPVPTYDAASFPGELLWIPRLDGGSDRIPCLFLKYASARFVVLYLHTNAEDLGKCHSFCSCLRAQFQVHVFAVEYPGYGLCPGGPCDERGLTDNAFAGLQFVREVLRWPLDSILIVGRSIGCGPTISLAVRHQVSGIIIISPMLSFRELCKDIVGPLSNVVMERFPNKSRMQFVRSSVLVVHGQKDATVPYRHGLELFKLCKSRKLFVGPEDMGHNANMFANVSYMVMPMLHFFPLPDYCFEDILVPSWAFKADASKDDVLEPPATPQTAAGSDEPASDGAEPTPDVDAPTATPSSPRDKRRTTIRPPPAVEQERTASRNRLAKISDRPSPVAIEAQISPLEARECPSGKVSGTCCFTCPALEGSMVATRGALQHRTAASQPWCAGALRNEAKDLFDRRESTVRKSQLVLED